MDKQCLVKRLQSAGISFGPGMTDGELDRAENFFDFRFPREIREFLSCGVPEGEKFYDYRDVSPENLQKFRDFQAGISNAFLFDLEHNREDLMELLEGSLGHAENFDAAVMDYLDRSPRLIPFYAHRCFFDGMDGLPIVSFWQPTDVIFYGKTFDHYLQQEFLEKDSSRWTLPGNFPEEAGIWRDLLIN